jgi:UDP:flavonoid glycosyltransferase YjiC (YdhE family)
LVSKQVRYEPQFGGTVQVLLITLGSIGDLMPFLAVAERLRTRGHRCVIASNAGYAQLVQAAGFPFSNIWQRSQQNLDDVIRRDPGRAWEAVRDQMFVPATEPTLAFITEFASREPSVVLASWSAFGAARARARLGVRLATAWLSPHPLSAHRNEAGPSDVDIALFPRWFAPASEPVLQAGFPLFEDALVPALPPDVEDFLSTGPPPVILTPGSFMRQARAFFEAGLKACAALDQRAILLTPYADQVPALPGWARHFPYINLQRLALRAQALIHHGGIGTAAQGLRAGLPQLLAPVFFDQFDNAARLEALGVGRRLADPSDASSVTAMLGEMLSPSVHERSRALRTCFGADDPLAVVCDTVESLA